MLLVPRNTRVDVRSHFLKNDRLAQPSDLENKKRIQRPPVFSLLTSTHALVVLLNSVKYDIQQGLSFVRSKE